MAKAKDLPITRRSLFSWVLKGKISLQLTLLAVIVLIVFLRVLPLEIQKRIVNDVLSFKDTSLLLVYCLIYFFAVSLASGLKFVINWLQTIIGQRAMTEIRQQVYSHILRLPLSFFRKTQAGTVSSSLVVELAPTADFIGMAIAVPVSNILTLLAFAAYLVWLNPLLGVITLLIYPVALFIIPRLQRGVNTANKQRLDGTQKVTNQITESISGIHEVHGHGSFWLEEQKFNRLVKKLLKIRIAWMLYRYGVKVINNLFIGLGPVLVFVLGGYLVIKGEIALGVIVAFLSAQEKLYDPWKELIEFYQVYQDASVRYKNVMQTFAEETEFILEQGSHADREIAGRLEVKNLDFATASGIKLLDNVNLTVQAGEHLALVGFSGSGKSTLAKCIAQLVSYTRGEVLLDGFPVSDLSKEEVVRNVGFIAQDSFINSGTVDENLLYAVRAINSYSADDASMNEPSLDDKITVLQQTGLFIDILRFGLNTTLDKDQHTDLKEKILRMRQNFQTNFGQELAGNVEFYHDDKYLYHSSVAENIIFGTPLQKDYDLENLGDNKAFQNFLDTCNLRQPLLETGVELIRQTVDIIGDVPKEEFFFAQTPVRLRDYDRCIPLTEKLRSMSMSRLDDDENVLIIDTALRFIPALHKIIVLQPLLERLVLNGRHEFRGWCRKNVPDGIAFFSHTDYLGSQSILNNIFFGNLISNTPAVEDRLNQCIVFLLVEEDLLETVSAIGMDFDVGSKGDKLSGGQRQKLAIARVLLKQPRVLIMDEATSGLDNKSQGRIQKLLELLRGNFTVISVIHRLDMLPSYDKVAVMKAGKIVEWGKPDELLLSKGVLYELTYGKNK